MLLLKICLSFFLLFSFQLQSSLFSLSPFSLLQQINHKKRNPHWETNRLLSLPNQMHIRFKHDRTNTSDPSLNESLNQDMEDDFIPDEIINSQKNNKKKTHISLSPFSFLQKIHHTKRKPSLETNSLLSVPNKMDTSSKHNRTNTSDPALNESLNQDMEDDFIPMEEDFIPLETNRLLSVPNKMDTSSKHNRTNTSDPFKNKHSKKNPCICVLCHQSLHTHFKLKQHYKNIHSSKKFIYKNCGQRSAEKYSAKTHEQKCLSNKNYKEENDLLALKNIEKNSPSHTENPNRAFFDISSLSIKELGLNNEEIRNTLKKST